MPVGLLGLATITSVGLRSLIAATAASMSRRKSSRRGKVTYSVTVSRAYSGYIEYVGAKLSAMRPGPAKAWWRCSITSLEPFAAQMFWGSRKST